MSKRNLFLVLPVAAALFLSACGGSVERPSAEAVADGLTKVLEAELGEDLFTPEQITCIAEGLEASEMSDKALAAIPEGDADAKVSTDEQKQVTEIMAAVTTECMTA